MFKRIALMAALAVLAACTTPEEPTTAPTTASPAATVATGSLADLSQLPVHKVGDKVPTYRPIWKVGYSLKDYSNATFRFVQEATKRAGEIQYRPSYTP